jgi:phosphonate transport system permease protein
MASDQQPQLKKKSAFRTRLDAFKVKAKAFNDKIWYRQVTIDISSSQDGSAMRVLTKKRPIAPILAILIIIALVVASQFVINFTRLKISWKGMGDIIVALFTPMKYSTDTMDGWWSYMGSTAIPLIWNTTEMCILATVVGAILSIPIYYLSAHNVAKSPWVYQPVRIFNDLLRTIPEMLFAIFARFFFGYGSFSGMVAMAVFSLGIMYQLMYEYIETLEMSPFEAISAAGGRNLQNVHLGLHPEIKPMFFANLLYTLEINIRASVILGYVGCGGFGYEMKEKIDLSQYDKVGALLVPLFFLVLALQITTNVVSRKLR